MTYSSDLLSCPPSVDFALGGSSKTAEAVDFAKNIYLEIKWIEDTVDREGDGLNLLHDHPPTESRSGKWVRCLSGSRQIRW